MEMRSNDNGSASKKIKEGTNEIEGNKKYHYLVTGEDLLNMKADKVPYLWEPFWKRYSLIGLAGSSDIGKSSFLRQLAISIVLKEESFLGHSLNVEHGRVIYFSTEDSKYTINEILKKQHSNLDPSRLKDLCYIFNADDPLKVIEEQLNAAPTDLVIIDCFLDVFNGVINDAGSVRRYLDHFSRMAEKYKCTFIFLTHNGKRTEVNGPNKNNIIGSQAFEAKMRTVMELRKTDDGKRQLYFTKGNSLPDHLKKKCLELEFDDHQQFTFLGQKEVAKIGGDSSRKFKDEEISKIMKEVTKLKKDGLSLDKILEKLSELDLEHIPSKGTLHKWISELGDGDCSVK